MYHTKNQYYPMGPNALSFDVYRVLLFASLPGDKRTVKTQNGSNVARVASKRRGRARLQGQTNKFGTASRALSRQFKQDAIDVADTPTDYRVQSWVVSVTWRVSLCLDA